VNLTAPTTTQTEEAFELILAAQAAPTTACSYLGTTRDGVRAELEDLDVPWRETLRVAVDDEGSLLGAVLVDWDEETARSWIHGPWTRDEAAWTRAAPALLDAAVALTPDPVEDHEVSAAPAHTRLADLAAARGWLASEVNIAYVARSSDGWPTPSSGVRRAVEADLEAVAEIHDAAFPGTYATARRLLADAERVTLVLEDPQRRHLDGTPDSSTSDRSTSDSSTSDNTVVGYASAEIHADGDGYLDFIALAPVARGRGLAAGLLSAIGREVLRLSPDGGVNLTVVESNAPAVALYERFGFEREAELVGYRTRAYG
jgi:ribosomal protein S18 acetylase RimI-like enzyme